MQTISARLSVPPNDESVTFFVQWGDVDSEANIRCVCVTTRFLSCSFCNILTVPTVLIIHCIICNGVMVQEKKTKFWKSQFCPILDFVSPIFDLYQLRKELGFMF